MKKDLPAIHNKIHWMKQAVRYSNPVATIPNYHIHRW